MRKLFILLLSCLFVVTLAGCKEKQAEDDIAENKSTEQVDSTEASDSEKVEVEEVKKEETSTSKDQEVEVEEVKNEEASTSKDQEVEQEQGINLLQYRPEVGSKKSFTENGELVFTEEIIAANDEYVQTLLQLGDNLTTQIYRWTKDEITLIYEEYNLENPHGDILNKFVPIEKFETIMNNDPSKITTWKLLSNEGKETVPAGEFKNVLIVEKTTEEVVNEETTYTRYYAPEQGLIKEEYKVTGENGYAAISELDKVE